MDACKKLILLYCPQRILDRFEDILIAMLKYYVVVNNRETYIDEQVDGVGPVL